MRSVSYTHLDVDKREFLCDSLCDNSSYDPDELVETYLEREDMLIIPNLGEVMKAYTDEDWTCLLYTSMWR